MYAGVNVSRFLARLIQGVVVLALLGTAAIAAELSIQLTPQDDRLKRRLQGVSLTASELVRDAATSADILAAARADYARFVSVLYDAAYYGPQVRITVDGREVTTIPAFKPPAEIKQITVQIALGPEFSFGKADVSPLAAGTALPEGFVTGARAESGLIEDAAKAAVTGWRDVGHAKADLSGQKLLADHGRSTLDAELFVAPGPRLTFGNVTTSGDSRVRPDRLREIAGLPQGSVFSPDDLKRGAERLRRTGVFRSVALTEAEDVGPNNTQDIDIAVVDDKRRRMGAGVELSSLEGLTLSALWMHRNLFGGAERLRLEAEVGGIGGDSGGQDLSFTARFDRPATFTPDTGVYLEGVLQDLSEPDFDERHIQLEAGLSHIFSDRLSGEAGVMVLSSDFTDDLGSRSRDYLMFPASLTWDGRDNRLDAHDGEFAYLNAMPLIGLTKSTAGLRLEADARWYHDFGARDQHVAALRFQAGSVIGVPQEDIPPSLLFYSGGGGTVRGQPYQSLAVDLGGGDRVGGRSFLGLSAEMRLALWNDIGLVGFADFGMIGADAFGGDTQSHSGAGLGLRYETGLGPLRFDVAAPVSGDTGDGVQFYIGIGQAF